MAPPGPSVVWYVYRIEGFEAPAELIDEAVACDVTDVSGAEEHAKPAAVLVLVNGERTEVVEPGVDEVEELERVLALTECQVEGGVISQRCP